MLQTKKKEELWNLVEIFIVSDSLSRAEGSKLDQNADWNCGALWLK